MLLSVDISLVLSKENKIKLFNYDNLVQFSSNHCVQFVFLLRVFLFTDNYNILEINMN